MASYVLDTDILTLYFHKHPHVLANVLRHFADVYLSIVSVDEVIQGWQKVIRLARTPVDISKYYSRYTTTIRALRTFQVISFEENEIHRCQSLKSMKLNVGANDLRLASSSLENQMIVVTRNFRDFGRVPNILMEDWSKPIS